MGSQQDDEPVKPTLTYRLCKWFFFACTIGVAIGILAIIDQHLQYLPFEYDGPNKKFQGRTVNILYCMLSSSQDASQDSRCNYAFTTAAVSLGISLMWCVYQATHKDTGSHKHWYRWGSCCWTILGSLWWIAAGIILSIWTDQANKANLPHRDARNGLCALAWANFVFFAVLATLLFLVLSDKMAKRVFDRPPKEPKPEKPRRKQKGQVPNPATAAVPQHPVPAPAPTPPHAPGPASAWPGAQGGPVGPPPMSAAPQAAAVAPMGGHGPAHGIEPESDNPFRAASPQLAGPNAV